MTTNGERLSKHSEAKGISLRTLADVKATLEQCKRNKADVAMARAMLRHGRLTEEAREYVAVEYAEKIAREYPQ